jgi:CRP/FNR family transcriptional regulator, cyclic AMP receptor protein
MTNLPPTGKHWSIASIAQLLVANNALTTLTTHHAVILAQRMRLCKITQDAVLFKAGDTNTDFMALILDGEALVEATDAGTGEAVVLKLVTEGDVLGEMGIVANTPRSATVTASTDMTVAILDQSAFAQLIKDAPDLACAFLSTLLHGVTNRLRESNRKLHTMTKINQSMYAELEASRNNESHLADLFASSSSLGLVLVKNDDASSPAQQGIGNLASLKPWDSRPPGFTQTYPI